jgi:hypothetical protein
VERRYLDDRGMTRRTVLALAAAVLVLTAACARNDPAPSTTVSPSPDGAAAPSAGPTTRTSAGPDGSRGPDAPGPDGDPAPGADATTGPIRVGDGGEPGDNAGAFLRAAVPKLVVEVDAVAGKAPRAETLDLLRRRLASVVDKPGGIRFLPVASIPAHGGAWSVDDLRAAERTHRDTHNTPDTASLYLLFVDGTPPKEGAIGISFSGSSAAIFSDQVADAATLLVGAAAIERADTVHEVGHLLSLVNLGYTSSRAHEDAQHRGHSDNPGSVMYWAVDNVGVATLLGGRTQPPTEFDADDQADLAAIRSGTAP